ncbi:hypothetical protein ACI6Q2_13755 [Chitinophagaceae bacterium LWZ2-11]
MPLTVKTVEIFKTDVRCDKNAGRIIRLLKMTFPYYKSNFDLNDCDNILRIESGDENIKIDEIEELVKTTGHICTCFP